MLSIRKYIAGKFTYLFRKVYTLLAPRETSVSGFYTSVPRSSARIPNKVYQTWKLPQLPSLHAYYVKKFRRLNPEYSFSFFDDARMADYMRTRYAGHPILDVFESLRIPASRADIWRYCILYLEGGVYCDIDSALSVPIRNLLANNPSELLSFEGNLWRDHLSIGDYADPGIFLPAPPADVAARLEHPDRVILNWFLCFEKESPILKEVIDLIAQHFPFYDNRSFESVWRAVIHCTGPLALTQAVWRWMEKSGRQPSQCGIDFNGKGIFKLPVPRQKESGLPHYYSIKNASLTR